jgi:hypothetical protein
MEAVEQIRAHDASAIEVLADASRVIDERASQAN